MSNQFVSVLLRNTGQIVPHILNIMQKDPTSVTEVKLSLLQRLQPRFHFRHADQLVHILEIAKTEDLKPEGNVLR